MSGTDNVGEEGTDAKPPVPTVRPRIEPQPPITVLERYSSLADEEFEYNMKHKNRGLAVIINNDQFDKELQLGDRPGSSVDRDKLCETLKFIGFKKENMLIRNNMSGQAMVSLMEEVARRDFTDMDCLFVAILSHGDDGLLYGTDRVISYEQIFEPFKTISARTLVGKPKLFLFQACRGHELDPGVQLVTDARSTGNRRYIISRESDFLVAYSTVKGYYAWRNAINGSWFVQAFCEVINRDGRRLEIGQLFARVNRMVSYTFKSSLDNPDMNNMKQSPCVSSTLTKSLYFN